MSSNAKRTVAMLCVAAILSVCAFPFSSLAGDAPKRLSPTTPPWDPGQATMDQLHDFFPHGMFWNHVVGDKNEAYSVTDTACSPYMDEEGLHDQEAGVTCNFFEVRGKVMGGWQCCGYARMVTYAYYGSSFENWKTESSLKNVKAGDVLCLWNYGPHYIWILSLKPNSDGTAAITYADCNGTGKRSHCQIQWDALGVLDYNKNVMKNPILGDWELQTLYASPEKPAPTAAPTTTTTAPPTTTTTRPPTTTTAPKLSVRYNLSGGEAGSKQYAVSEAGDLLLWETGAPVTDEWSAGDLSAMKLLSAEKAGLCKEGCVFAGWSVRKEDAAAAAAQAAYYPLSGEEAALWMRQNAVSSAVQDLKNAFSGGSRYVTLYALWVKK